MGARKARAEPSRSKSGPVESALFVDPDVADQQDAQENEHGDESESASVGGNPSAIENGPGKKKHGLHVEDNEEHRYDVKAGGIAAASVGFRGNAAFVGEEFGRPTARFRANQFEDEERKDREGKH